MVNNQSLKKMMLAIRLAFMHYLVFDMTGKIIVPFATSGGSGMGKINEKLMPSCKGARLLEGKVFKADINRDELAEWDKEADRITQLVYEAIKTKDGKALKEVFSTYTAQEHNLDIEIKVFFKKIKGKVISVEEINGYGSSGSKDAMKGDVLNRYVGDIINLKTDKGYSYHVSILGVYNYVGFEEKVGVSNIYLNYSDKCDYDDKLAEIGEY